MIIHFYIHVSVILLEILKFHKAIVFILYSISVPQNNFFNISVLNQQKNCIRKEKLVMINVVLILL